MKICITCRYYYNPTGEKPRLFGQCIRVEQVYIIPPDPITGESKTIKTFLDLAWERGKQGKCGPDGKFWEQKPQSPPARVLTLLERILDKIPRVF